MGLLVKLNAEKWTLVILYTRKWTELLQALVILVINWNATWCVLLPKKKKSLNERFLNSSYYVLKIFDPSRLIEKTKLRVYIILQFRVYKYSIQRNMKFRTIIITILVWIEIMDNLTFSISRNTRFPFSIERKVTLIRLFIESRLSFTFHRRAHRIRFVRSMSKFLVNVNAWFAVPYCDGDSSGRRRKGKGGEGRGSRSRRRGNLKLTYVGAALSPAPRTTCGSKQMVSTVPQCHTLHPARS